MSTESIVRSYVDSFAGCTPEEVHVLERELRYVLALRNHDWDYEWSDDHNVWRKGSQERSALRSMQREIDPDFRIWNTHCPSHHRASLASA